jgi:hypothetical protein
MARFVFDDDAPATASAAPAARFVLEDASAPVRAGPSTLSAFGRGAAQGATLGFGDEIQGALQAVLPPPGGDPRGYFGGMVERYRSERDAARGADRRAQQAHGAAYVAGSVVGSAPAAIATGGMGGAAQGAGLGARVLAGARAAAPMGAVYGAGTSEADSLGGLAFDTAVGGAGAAALGGGLPVVGEGVRRAAAPVARRLSQAAIEQGRKALSGIGTSLSARKPIPEAAVQQALDTGAIKPLGTVAGTAERLATQADELGGAYGDILSELEARGVVGPNAKALAAKLAAEADIAAANSLGSSRPGTLRDVANELTGATIPQHHGPPIVIPPKPTVNAAGDLGLMQAEKIKRQLQFEAQREYDKITRQYTTAGETKKELAASMRSAIEDAVQQQAALAPAEAAAFEPVKAKLANALAALRVAEEGAARAARRKPISLTSTIAGSAIGAGSGSPWLGLLGALGHGVVDSRLASTLARAANTGAKGANALARMSVPPSAAQAAAVGFDPEVEALLSVLRGRPGFAPAAAGEGDQ